MPAGESPYAEAARARKVDRLVGAALEVAASAAAVATDPDVRDALVGATGVREPSLETWRQVVERLAAYESRGDVRH